MVQGCQSKGAKVVGIADLCGALPQRQVGLSATPSRAPSTLANGRRVPHRVCPSAHRHYPAVSAIPGRKGTRHASRPFRRGRRTAAQSRPTALRRKEDAPPFRAPLLDNSTHPLCRKGTRRAVRPFRRGRAGQGRVTPCALSVCSFRRGRRASVSQQPTSELTPERERVTRRALSASPFRVRGRVSLIRLASGIKRKTRLDSTRARMRAVSLFSRGSRWI